FPSGRAALDDKLAEVDLALDVGADEIDFTIDRRALLAGREKSVSIEVAAVREAAPEARLKVILETGELRARGRIERAAWLAMEAGANMLKTSTGKGAPGADPASVETLLRAAVAFQSRYGQPIGVKASGGIRTVPDALAYLDLAARIGGPERV